jgi:hypothetical protein
MYYLKFIKFYYYLDPIDMPLGVKVEHSIILTLYINLHLMLYFCISNDHKQNKLFYKKQLKFYT